MLEKGKKFLNICLSTFLLLSIIFLFSVQNVKAEEETDTINPDEIQMSVDSLLTGISSKGFHPSKGNYLSIRAGVSFNTEQDLEGTAIKVRLRILNKSGKYVYEKTYKNNVDPLCSSSADVWKFHDGFCSYRLAAGGWNLALL